MRIKVELGRKVTRYLRWECNDEEQLAFRRGLDRVREDPIENSEPTRDPKVSRYMLRFFRFDGKMAVFQLSPLGDRIRVLRCRRLKERPRQGGPQNAP
jgi:hypothetical protein